MKTLRLLCAAFLLASIRTPAFAGWHLGEAKDLDLDIQYLDYAYLTPSGEPVYYIGTTLRFVVTLKNIGNRTFNNFQSKSSLHRSDDFTCQRWWLDNQSAAYQKDSLLPGNSDSGLRPASMRKQEQTSYTVVYPIPWEICPGEAYVRVEGRHQNSSGRDEVASFAIPGRAKLARK